jgi:hypothetical protein
MKINQWTDANKLENDKAAYGLSISVDGNRIRRFFSDKISRAKFRETIPELIMEGKLGKKVIHKSKTPLKIALEEHLEGMRQRKCRERSIESAEYRINRLSKKIGNPIVSEISRDDILGFLEEMGAEETRKGYRSTIVTFLEWCAEKGMGVTPGQFLGLKWRKVHCDKEQVAILSSKETEAFLHELPERFQPAMALCLFAGIRAQGELFRLQWKDVRHGEQIIVPGKAAKTRNFRNCQNLPDNLWSWIPKAKTGPICPKTYNAFRLSRKRAARRAGIHYPPNAARHSFGTYGYWRGMEWAMQTMGHWNYKTFQRHYVNRGVSKDDSDKYFSIIRKN